MIFLPIVERELRVAARRWPTYWLRAGAAFGAITVGTFMYLVNYSDAPHEIAKVMFGVLSGLGVVYGMFAGVRWTADSFSEEKREGTLGLLFLTDLKGYDVVLGKLAATSLGSFYGLLAIFPVLAIPLLMGGVTHGEFWRMALVLVDTFLFSLTVGIFVSTISMSSRKAMAGTLCLILLVMVILPISTEWIAAFRRWPRVAEALNWGCPFYAFRYSFDLEYSADYKKFWWSAGVIHGLSWICLHPGVRDRTVVLAGPGGGRGAHAVADGLAELELWRSGRARGVPAAAAGRERLLLAGGPRAAQAGPCVGFFGATAACWVWGWLEMGNEWFGPPAYVVTACVVNSVLKFWVASEAGRRLGEDRRLGALELLLSTPLSVGEILRGQLLALRRQFLAPVAFAMVVEFSFLVASGRKEVSSGDPGVVAFWGALILMLAADMIALTWVGMWVALTAHNPNRATGHTVLRLLVLPWLVILVAAMLGAVMQSSRIQSGNFILGMWVVTGLVFDLGFALNAAWHLKNSFREVAMQRFSRRRSWLKRWFGGGAKN